MSKLSLDDPLAEQTAPVTAEELARATQLLKMKEAEVDKYKRQNERLEIELHHTKLAYNLPKSDETRHRDEATYRLGPTRYEPASSNEDAEGEGRAAAAPVVDTSRADCTGMTSKLNVKAPTFTLAGNIEVFLKKLDNYFDMFASLTDKQKIKMLKSSLDDVTFEIVTHLPVPQEYTDDYSYMKKLCKQRFEPATSVNERRLQFRNERQGEDTLDQFYERLLKAATKAYPDIIDESQMDANLCDQLIFGLKDTGIKQKLLEMPPANSREALATAKRLLAAKRYSSTTQKIEDTEELSTVNYVHSRGQRGQRRGYRSRTYDGKPICFRCGGVNHMQANCTASIGTWRNRQQFTYQRGRSAPFRSRSGSFDRFGIHSYDGPRSSAPSQFSQRGRNRERSQSPRHQDDRWSSPDANQPSKYANRRRSGTSRPTSPKELIGTLTNGKTKSALLYVRGYVNQVLARRYGLND